eukprot:6468377-Amphidinium_carterae.3
MAQETGCIQCERLALAHYDVWGGLSARENSSCMHVLPQLLANQPAEQAARMDRQPRSAHLPARPITLVLLRTRAQPQAATSCSVDRSQIVARGE